MPELREGQKLRREIRVYGIESPVYVTITKDGISFQIKGTKQHVFASWAMAVKACGTPGSALSWLEGQPFKFLEYMASQKAKREIKKLDKA